MTNTNSGSHPALEVETLGFKYGGADGFEISVPALRLGAGEQILLTGGSGSGKSTLLQIIAGLFDPDRGSVRVSGSDMHSMHGAARDRFRGAHIGMIFQTFNLLQGFTAKENVLAALMFSGVARSEHQERASELLKKLGIARMDAPVESLSVGQQQRVAVARAVACKPALVLADEPTASLDPENSASAIELIQTACREAGAALLCTSHDPAMRGRFGRVESLENLRSGAASGAESRIGAGVGS